MASNVGNYSSRSSTTGKRYLGTSSQEYILAFLFLATIAGNYAAAGCWIMLCCVSQLRK